jgi:hypothetical protein
MRSDIMDRDRRSVLRGMILGGATLITGCVNASTSGSNSTKTPERKAPVPTTTPDPKGDNNTTEKTPMEREDSASHAQEVLKQVGDKYEDVSGIKISGMRHTNEEGWIIVFGVEPERVDSIDNQIPDQVEGIPIRVEPLTGPEVIGPVTKETNNSTSNSSDS